MNRQRAANRRPAFTLVELMVAMALIIFIMYVLAEAFSAGAGAFRTLKAIGDMNERLRGASRLLRDYLGAPHFDGKRRMSDLDFWNNGPPLEGFFRIWQTDGGNSEGNDVDGNPSFLSSTHHLHFTVRLGGKGKDQFFRAEVATIPPSPLLTLGDPAGRFQDPNSSVFVSPMAEVAFFLQPVRTPENNQEFTEDPAIGASGLQLYTLYFRQRLLNPINSTVQDAYSQASQYSEISHIQDPSDSTKLLVNTFADVAIPPRRFGQSTPTAIVPLIPPNTAGSGSPSNYASMAQEKGTTHPLAGSDVVLTDVISFDVRVLLDKKAYTNVSAAEDFVSLHDNAAGQYWSNTTSFGTARVFDTWTSASTTVAGQNYRDWKPASGKTPTDVTIPMYQSNLPSGDLIRIRAIQVTIRIWDSKTKQSRQTSVVVAL